MRRRLLSHIAAVALVLLGVETPEIVTPAAAAPDPTPSPSVRMLAYTEPATLPRAVVSTRTPLPQPVPVDPNAEPLPGPTAKPEAVPPPPTLSVGLSWPVSGPVTTWYSAGHPAVDVAATCGTPVLAPASGTITFAGWRNNGGGNVLDIDSGWGLTSLNHLNGFAVTSGWVNQGQLVAYVGASGWANGCHVHFALLIDGLWVNPLAFIQ